MKRNLLAAVLVFIGILDAGSGALAGSGAGAINLTFPIGARYNALGEAGVALAQDATASWWNPGGLAFVPTRPEQHDIQIMQSSLVPDLASDIAIYWGGYAAPLGSSGAVGFWGLAWGIRSVVVIVQNSAERSLASKNLPSVS